MAKSTALCNSLLKLLFNATAIANVADNAASSPLTNIYCALHTATPGAGGSQTTNEAAYGSYARVAVARTTGGFTASSAASSSPVAAVTFPAATSGTETETFGSWGTASSGAGILWYFGTVTPNIAVTTTVTPQLATSSTITEA